MTEPEQPASNRHTKRAHRSGNAPNQRQSVSDSQLHARRIEAVQLRVQGWTYDAIAAHQKLSQKVIRDGVRLLLSEYEAEAVPALRAIEAERLDEVVREAGEIMRGAGTKGTELALKAADRIMRAVSLRAALFGLNAPVELHVTEQTELDREIVELVRQAEMVNEITRQKVIEGEVSEAGVTPDHPLGG